MGGILWMTAMLLNKIIKNCSIKNRKLSLIINIEEVYRVFYDDTEICNTLDKEEADYLYELTKDGYNFEVTLKNEK